MSQKIESLAQLAEIIINIKGSVAVLGHRKPDGDAVGSVIGMVEILQAQGCDAIGMTPEAVPDYLRFMVNGCAFWKEPDMKALEGRTIIAVDTAQASLLGGFQSIAPTVSLLIDHHRSNIPYAQQTFTDHSATATAQILVELAQLMDVKINLFAATSLYVGLITDTNRFLYCESGEEYVRVMKAAACLAVAGVDVKALNQSLTNTVSLTYLKLLSRALQKAEFLEGGRIMLVGLTESDYLECGATEGDREYLKNSLTSIQGVEIGAVIRFNPQENVVKGSVRAAKSAYRVDLLCKQFGGGGHAAAAGIGEGIAETLETFLPRFREALLLHWKAYGHAK